MGPSLASNPPKLSIIKIHSSPEGGGAAEVCLQALGPSSVQVAWGQEPGMKGNETRAHLGSPRAWFANHLPRLPKPTSSFIPMQEPGASYMVGIFCPGTIVVPLFE